MSQYAQFLEQKAQAVKNMAVAKEGKGDESNLAIEFEAEDADAPAIAD